MELEPKDLLDNSFEKLLLNSDNESVFDGPSDNKTTLLVASSYNEDSGHSDEDNENSDDSWNEEIVARPLYPPTSVRIADAVKLLKKPLELYELFTEKVWPVSHGNK